MPIEVNKPEPGAPVGEAPAPKSQSEIGPVTYGGPNGPVNHGPDDPETKTAYAAGHPSFGLAQQRAAQPTPGTTTPAKPFQPGQSNPGGPNAPVTPEPGPGEPPTPPATQPK